MYIFCNYCILFIVAYINILLNLISIFIGILPDNRETEFDVQIQECISTLQEISSNMAKDVAILYSPEDIPTKDKEGEMVDPRDICSDLRLAGYNWLVTLKLGGMVFNATFSNISVISWRSVLLVEETRVPVENLWSVTSHRQTLSHNVVHLSLIEIQTHNISGDRN